MGLLQFLDPNGNRWRVWHVETPATRSHLMDTGFQNGWLVFEREDGTDRRRLGQVPEDWALLPADRLALLCECAIPAALATGQQKAAIAPPPDATRA